MAWSNADCYWYVYADGSGFLAADYAISTSVLNTTGTVKVTVTTPSPYLKTTSETYQAYQLKPGSTPNGIVDRFTDHSMVAGATFVLTATVSFTGGVPDELAADNVSVLAFRVPNTFQPGSDGDQTAFCSHVNP